MNPKAYIHPQALVDDAVQLGDDTKVWAFAQIMNGVTVGDNCSISGGCFLEGGCNIGSRVTIKNGCLIWDGVSIANDCFIGPNVTFTNDKEPRSPRMELARERYSQPENWRVETQIEQGVSIGAGSIILPGVRIGEYTLIGAGSLITKDVPSHSLCYGYPAKPMGKVCKCGKRKNNESHCEKCGYQF